MSRAAHEQKCNPITDNFTSPRLARAFEPRRFFRGEMGAVSRPIKSWTEGSTHRVYTRAEKEQCVQLALIWLRERYKYEVEGIRIGEGGIETLIASLRKIEETERRFS